jgi:hypothetical protein
LCEDLDPNTDAPKEYARFEFNDEQDRMVYYDAAGEELPLRQKASDEEIAACHEQIKKERNLQYEAERNELYNRSHSEVVNRRLPYLEFLYPPPPSTSSVDVKTPMSAFPSGEDLTTTFLPREKSNERDGVDEAAVLYKTYVGLLDEDERLALDDMERSDTDDSSGLRRLARYVDRLPYLAGQYKHLKRLVECGRRLNMTALSLHMTKLGEQWWQCWEPHLAYEQFTKETTEIKDILRFGQPDSILKRLDVSSHTFRYRLQRAELLSTAEYQHLSSYPRHITPPIVHLVNALDKNIIDWTHYMRLVQTLREDDQGYCALRLRITIACDEEKRRRIDWLVSPIQASDMSSFYIHCAELADCIGDMDQLYERMGRHYCELKQMFESQPYHDSFEKKKIYIPSFNDDTDTPPLSADETS